MSFNVSNFMTAISRILSVNLILKVQSISNNVAFHFKVGKIDPNLWTENTINFNNRPLNPTLVQTYTRAIDENILHIDVTAAAIASLQDNQKLDLYIFKDSGSDVDLLTLYSKQGATGYLPQLRFDIVSATGTGDGSTTGSIGSTTTTGSGGLSTTDTEPETTSTVSNYLESTLTEPNIEGTTSESNERGRLSIILTFGILIVVTITL